jgi:hypothetical protein
MLARYAGDAGRSEAGQQFQTIPSPLIGTGCLLAARSVTIRAGLPYKPATSAADHCQDETASESHLGIPMDDEIQIQDLATDEIRELLLEEGSELDEQQAAALKQFIHEIGGIENALTAVAMLGDLEEAA